ncbi:MAG: DUF3800 domain-containing protein [Verrucomicrobiae bacterium]|nr:DUF3800 domain-containing protein [Verrucomicrobiae bacterium]
MPLAAPDRFLYIFLDEAGNLDFSPGGTRYFILSSVAKERPFNAYKELTELKYDLVELGTNIEYFHAAEDNQATRNRVFNIIQRNLAGIRVDALVVEKRKTGPALRAEERFYPEMLGYLLRYVVEGHDLRQFAEVIVFTDRIPVQRKRTAVEKTIKLTLAQKLPKGVRYRILHHDSKSNCDLQIADYCNWAIYRKWDRADARSYSLIQPVVQSEFEIFRNGTTLHY